jgi:hypothetical protein
MINRLTSFRSFGGTTTLSRLHHSLINYVLPGVNLCNLYLRSRLYQIRREKRMWYVVSSSWQQIVQPCEWSFWVCYGKCFKYFVLHTYVWSWIFCFYPSHPFDDDKEGTIASHMVVIYYIVQLGTICVEIHEIFKPLFLVAIVVTYLPSLYY